MQKVDVKLGSIYADFWQYSFKVAYTLYFTIILAARLAAIAI
jgi:hypothetical protein